MKDKELFDQALEALGLYAARSPDVSQTMDALRERLAQPEPIIDKSAARRIATALGWVPPGDTSQERVDEAENQRQEQEPGAVYGVGIEVGEFIPPRREWVGLTAAEFRKAVDGLEDLEDCWVALEHALKEKNT